MCIYISGNRGLQKHDVWIPMAWDEHTPNIPCFDDGLFGFIWETISKWGHDSDNGIYSETNNMAYEYVKI